MIVAVNRHGIIGKNNNMLWYIPEDMQYFRRHTMHSVVIMGRKTYESLPNRYLDSRINVVITSQPEKYNKVQRSSTIFCTLDDSDEILKKIEAATHKRFFVIGGAEIYRHFFHKCNHIYVTMVQNDERDGVSILLLLQNLPLTHREISRTPKTKDIDIDYEFLVYARHTSSNDVQNNE